jgi:hypothetical protein
MWKLRRVLVRWDSNGCETRGLSRGEVPNERRLNLKLDRATPQVRELLRSEH